MKRQALALVVMALGFNTAFAGNNPRIDQALMETLAEKKEIQTQLRLEAKEEAKAVRTKELNAKYKAGAEVLVVGDELGGFTGSSAVKVREHNVEAIEDKLE